MKRKIYNVISIKNEMSAQAVRFDYPLVYNDDEIINFVKYNGVINLNSGIRNGVSYLNFVYNNKTYNVSEGGYIIKYEDDTMEVISNKEIFDKYFIIKENELPRVVKNKILNEREKSELLKKSYPFKKYNTDKSSNTSKVTIQPFTNIKNITNDNNVSKNIKDYNTLMGLVKDILTTEIIYKIEDKFIDELNRNNDNVNEAFKKCIMKLIETKELGSMNDMLKLIISKMNKG